MCNTECSSMENNHSEDAFMKVFKYYKSNKLKPNLQDVISVDDEFHKDKVKTVVVPNIVEDERTSLLGLKNFRTWRLYEFLDHPGLYFIRNPFTSLGQRYWIRQCLESYPRKPNKTNIDIEVLIEDWWKECHMDDECDKKLMKKLRWSTLGYHHNWDTKEYSEECRAQFPDNLAELTDVVALYLSFENFKAEAAIVNFYHMKSTLSAHTDHSEVNLDAPLFSFSFGQSAIFLIGGQDKSITPSAILLQSGDIMIMSKEARLCYHAVPKILPSSSSPWNEEIESQSMTEMPSFKYVENAKEFVLNMNNNFDIIEWRKFNSYIEESRINMNVRQVLNLNQTKLSESKKL